jgi:hypothetical protein
MTSIPTARWICVEAQLHINPAPEVGFVSVSLDDVPECPVGGTGCQFNFASFKTDPYVAVDVGVVHASMGQLDGETVYVDDVVISTEAIGCN